MRGSRHGVVRGFKGHDMVRGFKGHDMVRGFEGHGVVRGFEGHDGMAGRVVAGRGIAARSCRMSP